jgi:hypothetical protein
MFLRAIAALALTTVGSCASQLPEAPPEITLIEFKIVGGEPLSGILAVSEDPISRKDALSYESAIRGFVFVRGDPPRNLNTCFYIDQVRYGLTRVDMSPTGSFRFDLEKFPDAGVAYIFQVAPDGSVTGAGGFWGADDDSRAGNVGKVIGHYRLVANFDECTSRFPAKET